MPNRPKEPYAVKTRKLASGNWKGRVVRYDPDTGKRHEFTQTFDNKKAAKNWAEKEAPQYREDPNRKPPSDETVADFVQAWLDTMRPPRVRNTTWTAYRQKLQYVVSALVTRLLHEVTTQDIQALYANLGQQISPRSVNHVHRVLSQALGDAEDWNHILKNPARRAKPPRVTEPELRVPTMDESRILLEAVKGHRFEALWI